MDKVKLHLPKYEELEYLQHLFSDKKTMAFNKRWFPPYGIVPFPKEKWRDFYNNRIIDDSNGPYFFIKVDDYFVGEVSARYDDEYHAYAMNVKIESKYSGNGYGFIALSLLIDYLKDTYEANKLIDKIAIDNKAGQALFKKYGFKEVVTNKDEHYILFEYIV